MFCRKLLLQTGNGTAVLFVLVRDGGIRRRIEMYGRTDGRRGRPTNITCIVYMHIYLIFLWRGERRFRCFSVACRRLHVPIGRQGDRFVGRVVPAVYLSARPPVRPSVRPSIFSACPSTRLSVFLLSLTPLFSWFWCDRRLPEGDASAWCQNCQNSPHCYCS